MRGYPRSQQIEAFRAVNAGSAVVGASATRVDASPDPQRRRIVISNPGGGGPVYVKVANASDAAPTISSGNWHYYIDNNATLTLDIGPEVAVYGMSGGLGNITVQYVEF